MTVIGIIADTHIPKRAPSVPHAALRALDGADMIIHAGDATTLDVLDELSAVAPVHAVCGNMDAFRNDGVLPDKRILTIDKWRIAVTHGWGPSLGLRRRVLKRFRDEKVHCIVFGHSHRPLITREKDILLINPGSPTDRLFSPYLSVATLTVGDTLDAKIIKL